MLREEEEEEEEEEEQEEVGGYIYVVLNIQLRINVSKVCTGYYSSDSCPYSLDQCHSNN